MQKPLLSIIIPAYNNEKTIGVLLDDIFSSLIENIEIIIIDDFSIDKTLQEVKKYCRKHNNLSFIQLNKNGGPAKARNLGANRAKAEILLFLDSDIRLRSNTLCEVIRFFKEDKYRVAVTGVWNKTQKSHKFFPQFKALRDWSYWINERKTDAYYYLFSTRIAAIRRDVFNNLGGFNENYNGADVEDIEFTYRIAKKYRVDFNPELMVDHEFEDFLPIARKYFRRSSQWIQLFLGRRRFDPVAATGKEALAVITTIGLILFFVIGLFKFEFIFLAVFFLTWHTFLIKKFLLFILREKGVIFTIYSILAGAALYLIIFGGSIIGLKRYFFPKKRN